MKKFALFFILIITLSNITKAQKDTASEFYNYFTNQQLRIDYIRVGNADTEMLFLYQIKKEPYWGGPHKNLISPFNYGKYKISLYDSISNKLLFCKTYNTLFGEWRRSPEAKTIPKAFYESVVMPFPKKTVKLVFERRDFYTGKYKTEYKLFINPNDSQIIKDRPFHFKTEKLIYNGAPSNHLDIAFIAEGYTKKQLKKFKKDAIAQAKYMLSIEPFASMKKDINFYAIYSISEESGTDIPQDSIWKNTILSSHFNTFKIDRYLTIGNIKTMYDIASLVPYDQIMVIVNTPKYGGAGFYNFYNVTVSDNPEGKKVMVHEFGHGFGGLGDEYGYSDPANQNFYNLNLEPPEPNLTTLVNFKSKWENMVDKGVPIPTPPIDKYKNVVGAFEGAGYLSKGIYRPQYTCIMRKLDPPIFCKVCKKVLKDMINFYSDR